MISRLSAMATAVLLLAGCSGEATDSSVTASPSASPPAPPAVTGVQPAAQAYVDAVNRQDLDALVDAFAPDGRMIDVSRTIAGREAIRDWARKEVIGGRLRVVSIAERRADGQKLLVHWAPSGSDGWRAHYDFTVSGNGIRTADLQYA